MPPHPFREALDALEDAVYRSTLADERGGHDEQLAEQERCAAARAEVERLYAARVGEEYEVQTVRPEEFNVWEDGTREYYPDLVLRGPNPLKVEEGARVFVTKGEAG